MPLVDLSMVLRSPQRLHRTLRSHPSWRGVPRCPLPPPSSDVGLPNTGCLSLPVLDETGCPDDASRYVSAHVLHIFFEVDCSGFGDVLELKRIQASASVPLGETFVFTSVLECTVLPQTHPSAHWSLSHF